MSESEQPSRIETFLYDSDGNRTEDESVAVRGEVIELDAEGRVIARHAHDSLGWEVDPKSSRAMRANSRPDPSTERADARAYAMSSALNRVARA
jgi:hypothetical protein